MLPISKTLLAFALLCSAALSAFAEESPPVFSICTADLDGKNLRTIYADAFRQATHIRVAPDGNWIMFSRYNDKDPDDGLAKENWGGQNHYENTELMLMRSDGAELRAVVPPKQGIMAVNSNWTEDGRSFVFLSTDNQRKIPEIRRADLSAKMEVIRISTIALPDYLIPLDPHLHRGRLVFPAVDLRNSIRGLWIAKADGSSPRQLTTPTHPLTGQAAQHPASGDNDPRISPDGSEVAFMRIIDGHALWSIYVVEIASGKERNLSKQYLRPNEMDAVPEWSGDGSRLLFWTANLKEITINIASMRGDGTDRRRILNSPDIFQQSPAFFPNFGSGPRARIAFSTQRVPPWKLKAARLLAGFK